MGKKKEPSEKKGKGILLNLIPEKRKQLYDLAAKEKRTVTSIIEEALDIYIKNKLVKFNNGFGNEFNIEDELNLNKESKLW